MSENQINVEDNWNGDEGGRRRDGGEGFGSDQHLPTWKGLLRVMIRELDGELREDEVVRANNARANAYWQAL